MYYKSLDLTTEPFSTSPDPAFFYESTGHRRALTNLLIELRLRRGMSVILGDLGTGKTTLSRKLIQNLSIREGFIFHIILDPAYQDKRAFLVALGQTLGIEISSKTTISESELEDAIKDFLFEKGAKEDKTVVLIIDEAQKLSPESLEVLRILLNYESNTSKLLQLVLLGQVELYPKINQMPNLLDRVSFKQVLQPLSLVETREMIKFRLRQAGHQEEKDLFADSAVKEIHRCSHGYPRQVALLCHKALKSIVLTGKKEVDNKIIKHIVAGAKDEWRLPTKSKITPFAAAVPAEKGKISAPKTRSYLGFLLFLFLLLGGVLTWVALNYNYAPVKRLGRSSPPSNEDRIALIESFYERTMKELEKEQARTSMLISELVKWKSDQQLSNEELVKQINQLNRAQAEARERITAAVDEIVRAQSQLSQNDKALATRLGQLKDEFSTLLDNRLPGTIGRPIVPGEEIPEGVYTITIINAVITSTDWTDNDLGSKAAPPDCLVKVYQNDKEIFMSQVKPDTREPIWDQDFSLNWQKGDKLQVGIYDLDPDKLEKILGWDNDPDKEFLFKSNCLVSPQGSYLNYKVFSVLRLGKEE